MELKRGAAIGWDDFRRLPTNIRVVLETILQELGYDTSPLHVEVELEEEEEDADNQG